MTLLTVRKIFTALCKSILIVFSNTWQSRYMQLLFFLAAQVVPGILVVLIGYLGCDIILVLIIWFIAVTLITAGYAGAMANIVDIAPNFAGEYFRDRIFFLENRNPIFTYESIFYFQDRC